MKVIQIGITLCDEKGNFPSGTTTWQFNFKFDLEIEQFSCESIDLLERSGIDFNQLKTRGITIEKFGEHLMTSGLVLNDEVYFISFHGCYDFAYLLKILTNVNLPDTDQKFFETLKTYFPNFYDIRYLVRLYDHYRGSLQRLANELDVSRYGTQHQAGSDSIVTKEVFFTLKNNAPVEIQFKVEKNILFGFEFDSINNNCNIYNNTYNEDKFDHNYMLIHNNSKMNNNFIGYPKKTGYESFNNHFFPMNNINYQYMNFRNNQYNVNSNNLIVSNMNAFR